MTARLYALAAVIAGSAAPAAETAPTLQIGQRMEAVAAAAGPRNLSSGGPESAAFRHYELRGPLAARLTGTQEGAAYLVFKVAPGGRTESLVYASWKFPEEHEPALLSQFGVPPAGEVPARRTLCVTLSPAARLAVADAPHDRLRQAVLEDAVPTRQVRPAVADLCPPKGTDAPK
jgi:hypothetical protein